MTATASLTAISVQVGSVWERSDAFGPRVATFVVRSVDKFGNVLGVNLEDRRPIQARRSSMLTDPRFRFISGPTPESLEQAKTRDRGFRPEPKPKAPRVRAADLDRQRFELTEAVAKNVRRLRAERGMAQTELATEVGVSSAVMSKIELGQATCSLVVFVALAEALDCTLDDLVTGL